VHFQTKKRRSLFVNIVSYVDILSILVIFLVATTVFKAAQPVVKIDLPESSQAKPAADQQPVILSVTADEKIFLGEAEVPLERLAETLKEKLKASPDFKVAMSASKQAPFGTIVKVMDAAKTAGIRQLPTFTEEPAPASAP
jgi:biopolymer transport protein ExbD